MAKTKTEFLQGAVAEYRSLGLPWPATARDIAGWAIREGRWKPHPKNLIGQCAAEIAAAMRQEYYTDPQGRRVRRKHVLHNVKELPDGKWQQLFLWIDMMEATHEEAEMAFQYERKLIVGDCKQLKTDVQSYNDNNPGGKYVELSFNFGEDLEEAEQPTVYPGL